MPGSESVEEGTAGGHRARCAAASGAAPARGGRRLIFDALPAYRIVDLQNDALFRHVEGAAIRPGP